MTVEVQQEARQTIEIGLLWARLWPAARRRENQPLRRGAWYPVVQRDNRSLALKTGAGRVLVDVHQVETRSEAPTRFTIVRLAKHEPNPAKGTPRNLGLRYAVCPRCSARVRLIGNPSVLACGECAHRGGIDEI